jgi:hypothetical protein
MINPRTLPYTPQRLVAIKKEFTRPLPHATDSVFPFGASTFDELKGTSQAKLQSRRLAVAEDGILVTHGTKAAQLSSDMENKALNPPEARKGITGYVPYIIGGAIITLAIYLYFQSKITKEREETDSARL